MQKSAPVNDNKSENSDYDSEISGSDDSGNQLNKSSTSIHALSQSSAGGESSNSSATSIRRLSVGSQGSQVSQGSVNSRFSKGSKQSMKSGKGMRSNLKMQSIDETTNDGPLSTKNANKQNSPSMELFNITKINKEPKASPMGKNKNQPLGFGFSSTALKKAKGNQRAQMTELDEAIQETPREQIPDTTEAKSPARPSARERSFSRSPKHEKKSRDSAPLRSPQSKHQSSSCPSEQQVVSLETLLQLNKQQPLPDSVATFLLSQIIACVQQAKNASQSKKQLNPSFVWLKLSTSNIAVDQQTLRVSFNELPQPVVQLMNSRVQPKNTNACMVILQALAMSSLSPIETEAIEINRIGELLNQMLGQNSKKSPQAQELLGKILIKDVSQRQNTIYTQLNPSQQSKKTQGLKAVYNDKYFSCILKRPNLLNHVRQSSYKDGVCTPQAEKEILEWHYQFLDLLNKQKN